MTRQPARRKRRTRAAGKAVQLKPADPFELIRWLARSQSDPRKATAELLQNSLDAGARAITITRVRRRGEVQLLVRDDGEGVLPDASDREEALRYIATHIGHSRKLGLDPAKRHELAVAGKYGVGLLGFWSIGHRFELRSRVGGSPLVALRLVEDSPKAEITGIPLRTDDPETFTEAVVLDVHPTALRALAGRRLSDYLAAELRGQLLRSGARVEVHDRIARGLAQKHFVVTPRRFTGEPLDLPAQLEVEGHPPARVELFLARGADRPQIEIAAAGTRVADDIAELDALGLARAPWLGRELVGLIDFPGFNVPPGTRRGVMPDAAAQAFVDALAGLEPQVAAELARLESERAATLDRDVVRDLRRALRGLRSRLPQYELPEVAGGADADRSRAGAALPEGAPLPASSRGADPSERDQTEVELFPPAPLAGVRIVPDEVHIAPGAERRVRAVATDRDGRPARGVIYVWSLFDPTGVGMALRGEGPRPAMVAPPTAPIGAEVTLQVDAEQGERVVRSAVRVRVEEPDEPAAALGIPEPHLVSDADGGWRSRMLGERWEVNDAHEDYRTLRANPRGRVRYLLSLLAKEIVLRSSGQPGAADVLEAVVEILAHAERNLRGS